MHLRKVLLTAAAAAGAVLLVAACGGGDAGGGGGPLPPPNQSPQAPPADSGGGSPTSASSDGNASTGGSSTTSSCQTPAQTTVVGGALFVAQQGLIGATLLSNHGFEVQLGYSTCDGSCTTQQHQDAFAFAFGLAPPLFSPQTAAGTTLQLQPQGGIPINGQTVSTFPRGTPIFVVFRNDNDVASTANNKDLGRAIPESARVSYGPDNTATVDFQTSTGLDVRVGLTNVRGDLDPACPM